MARREHAGEVRTSHTPDSRYGACTCGWEAEQTHYGPLAEVWARGAVNDHLEAARMLADAQARYAERAGAGRPGLEPDTGATVA